MLITKTQTSAAIKPCEYIYKPNFQSHELPCASALHLFIPYHLNSYRCSSKIKLKRIIFNVGQKVCGVLYVEAARIIF